MLELIKSADDLISIWCVIILILFAMNRDNNPVKIYAPAFCPRCRKHYMTMREPSDCGQLPHIPCGEC